MPPLDQEFEFTDTDHPLPGDHYYVRATQLDDGVAWSSPPPALRHRLMFPGAEGSLVVDCESGRSLGAASGNLNVRLPKAPPTLLTFPAPPPTLRQV